jgi:PiT family inorganic phosphate transporter
MLQQFEVADFMEKGEILEALKDLTGDAPSKLSKDERKALKKEYRKELVKRSVMMKIISAWVITVPASGLMAAMLYFTIRGMLMP